MIRRQSEPTGDVDADISELLLLATPELDPSRGARERLMGDVERAPLRFAPFFDRTAQLFDVPVERIERLLARVDERSAWKTSGLPGVRVIDVKGGQRCEGASASLVKFRPGLRFPSHVHQGAESVLILAGSYLDDSGIRYRQGDRHDMEAGTAHGFRVSEDQPCIAAAVLHGRLSFESWPLRLLARIMGR